jgi:hypothetical protein
MKTKFPQNLSTEEKSALLKQCENTLEEYARLNMAGHIEYKKIQQQIEGYESNNSIPDNKEKMV